MPYRAVEEALDFGQVVGAGARGSPRAEPFFGICIGRTRQGRGNSLRLVSLNNSCGLGGIRADLPDLVLGLGLV